MDGAEVSILKEADQIRLRGFLESQDSRALEAEIGLEVLSDLSDETLEGELTDEELRALLILPDLSESYSTRAEAMRFLDAACGRSRFPSGLGGQLLAGSLASGRFPRSLLGSGHG